jgi:hypothetical protein
MVTQHLWYKFKQVMKLFCLILLGMLCTGSSSGQVNPNQNLSANIQSVRLHVYGDPESMPVINLNSDNRVELHFDDMDTRVKNYYYTFQLCDINWQPVNLSAFDYLRGFTQMRITNYRFSTIAFSRYVHYQVILPENNCVPSRSGNYLLKVYMDGDSSKTIFTRALLVLSQQASLSAQILQPFGAQQFRSHQRIRFTANVEKLNAFNAAQQLKVKVLQNYRWDRAQGSIPPTFVRGNNLEYNTENSLVFAGGREWRWLDLRSLRLLSDRVDSAAPHKNKFELYVKPDRDRSALPYLFYADLNGLWLNTTYESINPYWQADYATVHFKYLTPNMQPIPGKELYLSGDMTAYNLNEQTKMVFNETLGYYEGQLYLKQGYYNYGYTLVDNSSKALSDADGSYWETENVYTILLYYRSFTDLCEQLIGVAEVSTRLDRPGFSF